MRQKYADSEVVEGAELIVVAHLQEDSVVYIPHNAPNNGGRSWEHRAVLVITEVLKGHANDNRIPVIIHYGLIPITGGYLNSDHLYLDLRQLNGHYPKDVLEIFDTAEACTAPSTGDIRKDQIWFLRVQQQKDQKYYGNDNTDALGVWDPENIQPPELKPYFQAYLTDHLEDKLQEYSVGNSPLAVRSREGLAHLKMQAALQEPDLAKRAELLLPFFLFTGKKPNDPIHWEATINLRFRCGQAGAARLVSVFSDPKYKHMQTDIMYVWDESGYRECLPIVTELLNTENQFWASQSREQLDLWTNISPSHSPTADQSESENRLEAALQVIRHFADPQSKPIVEEIQRLWERLRVETIGDNILKACDDVLTAIDEGPTPR